MSRSRKEQQWHALLEQLESLGVVGLGSEMGYSPQPVASQRAMAAMRDSTISPPEITCRHLGGGSLLTEVLDGDVFRQAHFWCLEAPLGQEHARASQALELLKGFIGGVR